MGYSNVGTPKFYIDYLNYSRAIGVGGTVEASGLNNTFPDNLNSLIGLNPTNTIRATKTGAYSPGEIDFYLYDGVENVFNGEKVWCGIFGHNFADSEDCHWAVGASDGTNWGWFDLLTPIVNTRTSFRTGTDYNGWSLFNCNAILSGNVRLSFYNLLRVNWDVKLSGFAIGKEYTMRHSPELKLTMSREMDGVKRIRTKGGADLVKHQYTKPAMWGEAGSWELYSGTPTNQALSRIGRRTWSLSFNYLQGSDIFPMLSSLNPYGSTSPSGTPYSDTVPADDIWNHIQLNWEDIAQQWQNLDDDDPNYWWTDNTLLDSDNFYSQVVQKVQGSRLPFIFQPDSNNNNDFAICKFDKSFSFQQTAPNLYSVKMKIREVW